MEQVLNKPLSGEEVKEIILHKVKEALDRDGTIGNFFAYPSFSFHAEIAILLPGAMVDKIDKQVSGTVGTMTDEQADNAAVVGVHASQEPGPPNEIRMENDMGVPVATHDEQGRPVEKNIKYAKEDGKAKKRA